MRGLAVLTLRRRVRRLAIRLEVEAFSAAGMALSPKNESARDLFLAVAATKRDAAARIREVLDDADE